MCLRQDSRTREGKCGFNKMNSLQIVSANKLWFIKLLFYESLEWFVNSVFSTYFPRFELLNGKITISMSSIWPVLRNWYLIGFLLLKNRCCWQAVVFHLELYLVWKQKWVKTIIYTLYTSIVLHLQQSQQSLLHV